MAYSEKAIELRKCLHAGCKNWALWGAPDQQCRHHTSWAYAGTKLPAPVCNCDAYAWPHRPGGGLCEWPDKPSQRSKTPQGKRKLKVKKDSGWIEDFSYDARKDPISKLERYIDSLEDKKIGRTKQADKRKPKKSARR